MTSCVAIIEFKYEVNITDKDGKDMLNLNYSTLNSTPLVNECTIDFLKENRNNFLKCILDNTELDTTKFTYIFGSQPAVHILNQRAFFTISHPDAKNSEELIPDKCYDLFISSMKTNNITMINELKYEWDINFEETWGFNEEVPDFVKG